MGIQDIIEGKKQWRAHMARVKALPPDHQIVYKEIQTEPPVTFRHGNAVTVRRRGIGPARPAILSTHACR